MSQKCANCGSYNTQTQVDKYSCNVCGRDTSYETGAVPAEDHATPVDLNEPLVQEYAPYGSPAGRPRTPDGVADHGTNIEGMDEDAKKGVPVSPAKQDERPTSMQTEHNSADAQPVPSDVHVDDPRGHDMSTAGGFVE